MSQFDVHRNLGRAAKEVPFLVVMQHDYYAGLPTLIVAPALLLPPERALSRVMPRVTVGTEQLFLSMPEIFAIEPSRLGPVIGSVAEFRLEIVAALDRLITGV